MAEYRIDELARAAGTTVRNVRVYQDRGLLPPPRREGRVGLYSDAHLGRLRLIGQLLERGYTFAHIAELVATWQEGRDISQLLGLEQAMTGPWSDEIPDYATLEQLLALFGEQAASPEFVERAVALGIVQPEGDGRFRVPSPRLLHAGAELVAAGMPLSAVLDVAEDLQRHIAEIARHFVAGVTEHVLRAGDPAWMPEDEDIPRLAEVLRRLRPLAQMAVDAQLARAMEHEVRASLGEHLEAILGHRRADGRAS